MRFIKDKDAAGRQPEGKKSRRGRLLRGIPGLSLLLTFALVLAAGVPPVRTYTQERWYGEQNNMTLFDVVSNEEPGPPVGGESAELSDFFDDENSWIADSDGNKLAGGALYVGESYTIHLSFTEKDVQGLQFDTSTGKLTYHLPDAFKVNDHEKHDLTIQIDGKDVTIGTYSVSEDGTITVELTNEGKERLKGVYKANINFNITAEAQSTEGDGSGMVKFDGAGEAFNFKVTEQPCVSVEKQSKYIQNEGATGGSLEYTVKTTVKKGPVHQVEVTDVLTPPQTDSLRLDGEASDVKVMVKKADGTETELGSDDYELVKVDADPKNPDDKAFMVRLDKSVELNEGDELYVTYKYDVEYVPGSVNQFWGNVLNTATVTGMMSVEDPADPLKKEEVPFKQESSSNVEIVVTPPGDGIICKTQEYSESSKTLHYTLYTVVPAGEWAPLFIQDDMVVKYNGERWYIPEFKDGGRVNNLEVSVVDATGPDKKFSWSEDPGDPGNIKDLEKLKGEAKELESGYKLGGSLDGYNSENMDQYVYRYGNEILNIIFGYKEGDEHGAWGHWTISDRDRLIITEYDLDMSGNFGETITLTGLDHRGTTIEVDPDVVLRAGITNTVNLRFSGYYPGYVVFFNNVEAMNKAGELNKNTNTIDYTVTINTTDSTVRGYFNDVFNNIYDVDWNFNRSIQAMFYDVLPDGWEYEKGTLYATAYDKWDKEPRTYKFDESKYNYNPAGRVEIDGEMKNVIQAPFFCFWDSDPTHKNHELINEFGGDNLVKITFTYTLKATPEWIDKHATKDGVKTEIVNKATIKDKDNEHWDAEATIPYLPARLTKAAEQVTDGSNRLKFTLQVNPNSVPFAQKGPDGKDMEPQEYLIVTDISKNLQIQNGTIVVTNANTGEELTTEGKYYTKKDLEAMESWPKDQWGWFQPDESEGEGQFSLIVPNGVHLTVTYEALIMEMGNNVETSNEAKIEGVEMSDAKYKDSLNVTNIEGGGSAGTYKMTLQKVSKDDKNQKLAGAEFKLYMVLKEGVSSEQAVEKMINGTTYRCSECFRERG